MTQARATAAEAAERVAVARRSELEAVAGEARAALAAAEQAAAARRAEEDGAVAELRAAAAATEAASRELAAQLEAQVSAARCDWDTACASLLYLHVTCMR